MRRYITLGFFSVATMAALSRTAAAQAGVRPANIGATTTTISADAARARPAGVQRLAASLDRAPVPPTPMLGDRPPRSQYVLIGAASGVIAAGLAFAFTPEGEASHGYPFFVAIAIPSAGLVGAGLGWLVHAIVH